MNLKHFAIMALVSGAAMFTSQAEAKHCHATGGRCLGKGVKSTAATNAATRTSNSGPGCIKGSRSASATRSSNSGPGCIKNGATVRCIGGGVKIIVPASAK